ncbi:hypothetical protein NUW54_g8057 [Trametes sanguinea]|uniref:Uncharacterized protein n=1 Tax=Trametes sanguinea TaxID=158606 RepID=A0ACC1PG26_9APHY|nr:hypothetical protein NUW54_g8057 [Trametes sanguinea]
MSTRVAQVTPDLGIADTYIWNIHTEDVLIRCRVNVLLSDEHGRRFLVCSDGALTDDIDAAEIRVPISACHFEKLSSTSLLCQFDDGGMLLCFGSAGPLDGFLRIVSSEGEPKLSPRSSNGHRSRDRASSYSDTDQEEMSTAISAYDSDESDSFDFDDVVSDVDDMADVGKSETDELKVDVFEQVAQIPEIPQDLPLEYVWFSIDV